MNINPILWLYIIIESKMGGFFMSKKSEKYTKDQQELIHAIEIAKSEIDTARSVFQLANDPMMVDYAIFMEEAAKSKYAYLLMQAKAQDLRVECDYMITEMDAS